MLQFFFLFCFFFDWGARVLKTGAAVAANYTNTQNSQMSNSDIFEYEYEYEDLERNRKIE